MPLADGAVLENRYRIAGLLGQGGMGAVYSASDLRFNAPVAIKENRMVTPEAQKQFTREKVHDPLQQTTIGARGLTPGYAHWSWCTRFRRSTAPSPG